jgi:hypothetical protein
MPTGHKRALCAHRKIPFRFTAARVALFHLIPAFELLQNVGIVAISVSDNPKVSGIAFEIAPYFDWSS